MQKRLVKVGNSLGLVIDKSLLSVMNVTRTTRLRMTLEGGRLVVEPMLGDCDPRPPTAREALAALRELERLGLRQEHFDQIAPVPMRLGTYMAYLDYLGPAPPHELMITVRRMSELRQRLRFGWPKSEAIAAAIAAVPFELPTGVETRLD